TVPDAVDMDTADGDHATSRRHSGEIPGMGSRSAPPGHHLVVLGHLIVHGYHQAGKGSVGNGYRRGVSLGSGVGAAGDMTHEGRIKQLPEQSAIASGEDLVVIAAYQSLVLRQVYALRRVHADMLASKVQNSKA